MIPNYNNLTLERVCKKLVLATLLSSWRRLIFNINLIQKLGRCFTWPKFFTLPIEGHQLSRTCRSGDTECLIESLTSVDEKIQYMKKWRRDLDNSRNGLRTLERWGFPTADLWFENLYRQIKVNWINGWKDDGCVANYSHYLSLCCSTRRVDLADFIFSSCKGVNMAWRDRQSAKVWNTRVGRRGITQALYSSVMAWPSKHQNQKVHFLNVAAAALIGGAVLDTLAFTTYFRSRYG